MTLHEAPVVIRVGAPWCDVEGLVMVMVVVGGQMVEVVVMELMFDIFRTAVTEFMINIFFLVTCYGTRVVTCHILYASRLYHTHIYYIIGFIGVE